MAYRKILVPFSGSDQDAGMLSTSFSVAKKFDAFCQVVFIRPEPYQVMPYLGGGSPGVVIPEVIDSMNQAAENACTTIRSAMSQAAQDHGIEIIEGTPPPGRATARFDQIEGDAGDIAARSSWLTDLTVFVSGAEDSLGLSRALVAVLLSAGRPVLILPRVDYAGSVGQHVTMAWDGSVEASNAVKGALPFMKQAESVKMLSVQEHLSEKDVKSDVMDVLGEYLELHAIKHSVNVFDPQGQAIGEALLKQATAEGSDLLVMGAYGHSRVREMLLGGVTQYILDHATIPVLMAH